MLILMMAAVGLLTILYPVIIGAKVVDKADVPSAPKAVVETSVQDRLQEAFSNRPFTIAMMMILMTISVISVAGIVVFKSYSCDD